MWTERGAGTLRSPALSGSGRASVRPAAAVFGGAVLFAARTAWDTFRPPPYSAALCFSRYPMARARSRPPTPAGRALGRARRPGRGGASRRRPRARRSRRGARDRPPPARASRAADRTAHRGRRGRLRSGSLAQAVARARGLDRSPRAPLRSLARPVPRSGGAGGRADRARAAAAAPVVPAAADRGEMVVPRLDRGGVPARARRGRRALAAAMCAPGPVCLRANALRIGRDELARLLEREGVLTRPGRYARDALVVTSARPNLLALRAYREGLFEAQDEGSQLVAQLVQAQPGGTVLAKIGRASC